MPQKNEYVELKVLTAVLEERFENQRQHFERRLKSISDEFKKGSARMNNIEINHTKAMENLAKTVKKNSTFIHNMKIIIATISSIFGAGSALAVLFVTKIFNKFF